MPLPKITNILILIKSNRAKLVWARNDQALREVIQVGDSNWLMGGSTDLITASEQHSLPAQFVYTSPGLHRDSQAESFRRHSEQTCGARQPQAFERLCHFQPYGGIEIDDPSKIEQPPDLNFERRQGTKPVDQKHSRGCPGRASRRCTPYTTSPTS